MAVLNSEQIHTQLKELQGWTFKNNAIEKEWTFKDFKEALHFINKIGEIAEKHNHHPELFNVYSRVTLRFNTHDEGGVTEKDIHIAIEINSL
jgi:4a-hydroxytetrahydrobiopterin dehydratase